MRRPILALLLVLGCGHGEPFADAPPVPLLGPFRNGLPTRLTYNPMADGTPSWSPDGSRIYWSAEQPLPGDLDRCVSAMPAIGGTLTRLQCPPVDDTTDQNMIPTSDGTRLAWTRNRALTGPFASHTFSIWTAGVEPKAPAHLVWSFPYNAPSGNAHDMPLDLQWLKPGVLLYLGGQVGGCCAFDTLRFGEQVVTLDLSGAAPAASFIPGTLHASAVSRSEDGTTIYYTFPGDSVVYQQVLASGAVTPLHNFGDGHVVRDPTVAGTTLVAIVDGRPKTQDLPPFGVVNVDFGGELAVVDLTSGQEVRLNQLPNWYRRPRLAPGGGRFVVEGYPLTITVTIPPVGPAIADTAVSLINDIWLWEE